MKRSAAPFRQAASRPLILAPRRPNQRHRSLFSPTACRQRGKGVNERSCESVVVACLSTPGPHPANNMLSLPDESGSLRRTICFWFPQEKKSRGFLTRREEHVTVVLGENRNWLRGSGGAVRQVRKVLHVTSPAQLNSGGRLQIERM